MSDPKFTLIVVSTADGFIARHPGHSPATWASPEEQSVFFDAVEAADWAVMGRGTHDAADKPHRRRIIFSRSAPAPEWRRDTQVWLDPAEWTPKALTDLVSDHREMRSCVILGGTPVHDWFLAHRAIDDVLLTIEPVQFGAGLPIFSDQNARDPMKVFRNAGFASVEETALNATGTRLIKLRWSGA